MTVQDLKNSAHWFLYIFIAQNSNLGSMIMAKRANQIEAAKRMAASLNMDYNTFSGIIYQGITERYGMTPNEALQRIYNAATGVQVSGIDDPPFDYGQAAVNYLEVQTGSGKTNIWTDIASIINSIGTLFQSIGMTKSQVNYNTPRYSDWSNLSSGNQQSSSFTQYLPYLAIGGVALYLFMGKKKKK